MCVRVDVLCFLFFHFSLRQIFSVEGAKGTILAGFHYDLNFLTIHGKSRFPGLYIWTREGKKTQVVVPDGCLLIQVASCCAAALPLPRGVITLTHRFSL